MARFDIWDTARLLVERDGMQARLYADGQALGEFLCGEVEASAIWEEVAEAVETLLEQRSLSSVALSGNAAALSART